MATNTNSAANAPQNLDTQHILQQKATPQETRAALTAQTEASLKSLGRDVENFAKRLRATETMSALEAYNSFKEKVLGTLKPHVQDFDRLTIPQIFQEVKNLPPKVLDTFLGHDVAKITKDIGVHVEEVLKESGLDQAAIDAAIATLSEGGVDMTSTVQKLGSISQALVSAPPVMENIAEQLPEENILGGPLNFLRKFIGMSETDVAPREMLTFLQSFRQEELKERNADFTKENFSKYIQENQGNFLGLFQQSKTGVTTFMEFMKDSPSSVRDVFATIGANAPALSSYSANLTDLDTNLATLLEAPLRAEYKDRVQKDLEPLARQFGTTMTGDLRRDITTLRLAVDKTQDALASMLQISQMPLVEKAGFIHILEQVAAQKLTGDAVAVAFFGLQMLIAFQGGLLPTEAGQWAGSSIVEWFQRLAPQMNIALNAEQIQGLKILFTAIGGMSLVGGVTAAVVKNAAGETVQQQEAPQKRNYQEELTENIAMKGAGLHEAAMQVSGFSDASKKVLRQAMATTDGRLSSYVSEDPKRVAQYRSAILQMRDDLRTNLENETAPELSDAAIKDMATQEYDTDRAAALRTALSGVELKDFTDQSALEAKIRERIQANVMSPVGFEYESGKIAAQILSMKHINAKEAQKTALAEYMRRLMTVYNQIQQVLEKPDLALSSADISIEMTAKVPETNERNVENIEQQNQLQVEVLARSALFNLEKKYSDNLPKGQTLIPGRFATKSRMLEVFGNAIMNSILRGIMNDPKGNYVQSGAQFTGSKVETWLPIELASARGNKQVLLPDDFDQKFQTAMRDETLTAKITKSLNDLILSADGNSDTSASLLFTESNTPTNGRFDAGASISDRLESGMTQANFEINRAALDQESKEVEAKLGAISEGLRENPAFSMLSVLRGSVINMKSPGAAMQFIAKKIQETMLNNGGPSSFVEAWATLQKDPGTMALLQQYDAVRTKAYASGIKQPGLESLEGEVSAMYTMMHLSTPELLQVLSQARNGNILKQLGQGGEAIWFMSKMAFMIVGWDRIASWAKLPDWKWQNPFTFSWNTSPAASTAPSAASAMIYDPAGIATFAVLGTAMYSAAAITSVHTHMRLREKTPQDTTKTPDILPTSIAVPVIKEVEKQTNSKQVGSTWKFHEEKADMDRLDRMLKDTSSEATMLRSSLAKKYSLSDLDTAGLREKLMEELRASYAERSRSAHADVLALSHQAIEMRATELKLSASERAAWIARQDQNVRSSFSYMAPQTS